MEKEKYAGTQHSFRNALVDIFSNAIFQHFFVNVRHDVALET